MLHICLCNSTSENEKLPKYGQVTKQPAGMEPMIGEMKQTVNPYIWFLNRCSHVANARFGIKNKQCKKYLQLKNIYIKH